MIVPAERELRAALAQFASARIEHDAWPSGGSSRALEDAAYTLCVMTASRRIEQALLAADALLERYGADRESFSPQDGTRREALQPGPPAEVVADAPRLNISAM